MFNQSVPLRVGPAEAKCVKKKFKQREDSITESICDNNSMVEDGGDPADPKVTEDKQ